MRSCILLIPSIDVICLEAAWCGNSLFSIGSFISLLFFGVFLPFSVSILSFKLSLLFKCSITH